MSRDGNFFLLATPAEEAMPFDTNHLDDVILAVEGLFGDGFESGSTAAWSLTLP